MTALFRFLFLFLFLVLDLALFLYRSLEVMYVEALPLTFCTIADTACCCMLLHVTACPAQAESKYEELVSFKRKT